MNPTDNKNLENALIKYYLRYLKHFDQDYDDLTKEIISFSKMALVIVEESHRVVRHGYPGTFRLSDYDEKSCKNS